MLIRLLLAAWLCAITASLQRATQRPAAVGVQQSKVIARKYTRYISGDDDPSDDLGAPVDLVDPVGDNESFECPLVEVA